MRIHNVMFQSEIFERLLEEAEQMHIKRKEATEMLKVLQRIKVVLVRSSKYWSSFMNAQWYTVMA